MIPDNYLYAGARFYEQYYGSMIRKAKRYVSDIHDAEDIVSACWVSLLLHMERLVALEETMRAAYILAAVKNASIDFLRKQSRQNMLLNEVDEAGTGEEWLESIEYQELLAILLKQLPPYEARIVGFKLMKYTSVEIADLLHISPVSVRIYWMRARKHLRNYLLGLGLMDD